MSHAPQETIDYLKQLYNKHFGEPKLEEGLSETSFFVFASAPGRVELAGNHTDHQGGYTISAAINQRVYALAASNKSNEIHLFMDGFGKATISLSSLEAQVDEYETSTSLVRGMAAAYAASGKEFHGFNLVTCSKLPIGCGVSSSAAFEMLIGTVIRALFNPLEANGPLDPTKLALEGAWAECNYFGKPCGTQDQLASAHGGILALDFSKDIPQAESLPFPIETSGYTLFLVDSNCDHSHYTQEFANIPGDMRAVAQHFNASKLSEVAFSQFLECLPEIRTQLGDRATLRALHYFEEAERVLVQQEALRRGDFEGFLELLRLSGASSAQFLQSLSPHADVLRAEQPATIILALCAHLLENKGIAEGQSSTETAAKRKRGAYRIHGGGFGGSILAVVPNQEADSFMAAMNAFLGYDACMPVSISDRGAYATRITRC